MEGPFSYLNSHPFIREKTRGQGEMRIVILDDLPFDMTWIYFYFILIGATG
jgi:hypothetical protein